MADGKLTVVQFGRSGGVRFRIDLRFWCKLDWEREVFPEGTVYRLWLPGLFAKLLIPSKEITPRRVTDRELLIPGRVYRIDEEGNWYDIGANGF